MVWVATEQDKLMPSGVRQSIVSSSCKVVLSFRARGEEEAGLIIVTIAGGVLMAPIGLNMNSFTNSNGRRCIMLPTNTITVEKSCMLPKAGRTLKAPEV
jgi:hypothetical protein